MTEMQEQFNAEKQRLADEHKRRADEEKQRAIADTKQKQWVCSLCLLTSSLDLNGELRAAL